MRDLDVREPSQERDSSTYIHGSPNQTSKRKSIIIIDDDKAILEALSLLFKIYFDDGYNIETSESGGIISKFNGFKPDLILLDLRLSGEDGTDIVRRLKSDARTKKIPIIMMSAHPSAERYMRESGADDFIPKPFDITAMYRKVSEHMRELG